MTSTKTLSAKFKTLFVKRLAILPIMCYNSSEVSNMKYYSVQDFANKWNISERSVRNYCNNGSISGAVLQGKTWKIPENAVKPQRRNAKQAAPITLLDVLRDEKQYKRSGGIYHKVQVELTYNSNHIEGSRLTHDQTRYIYETNTVGITTAVNVDDIVETVNHFRCIDLIIDNADKPLTEKLIKQLHGVLKTNTSDSRNAWFAVGDYKLRPNEVGMTQTTAPEDVHTDMERLLVSYNSTNTKTLEDILDFHQKFECIHPFQDGNGRVGRLIMFKECLRNNIVPFIISDDLKMFYYQGLREWKHEKGFLRDTCLTAQDRFKAYLEYYRIRY